MEKLELKHEHAHLCAYLPYDVECDYEVLYNNGHRETGREHETGLLRYAEIENHLHEHNPIKLVLHLRPLSDLTKDDFLIYFEDEDIISDIQDVSINHQLIEVLPYFVVNLMFKHHFDVFGLIEKGLAIDINTLD